MSSKRLNLPIYISISVRDEGDHFWNTLQQFAVIKTGLLKTNGQILGEELVILPLRDSSKF